MSLTDAVLSRVRILMARVGEPVTITAGATTTTVPVVITALTASRRHAWFGASETSGWTLPGLLVRAAGDLGDTAPVGATFTREGRTFTVRKIERVRLAGVVVQTMLMCA